MTGLLTQKPDSQAPNVGSVKRFTWEERKGKSGKPYIKIKNAKEDEGQDCEILTVERTDFVDSYGNVSYNVEFTPVEKRNGPMPEPNWEEVSKPSALDARQRAIIRQHSQSMAIEVLKLKQMLNEITIEDLTPSKLKQLADYFDNDVLGASQ